LRSERILEGDAEGGGEEVPGIDQVGGQERQVVGVGGGPVPCHRIVHPIEAVPEEPGVEVQDVGKGGQARIHGSLDMGSAEKLAPAGGLQ
jgi:hypothetical protein